jgi:hypothetical protein
MEKHQLDARYSNDTTCPFAIYHQFFRELLFALEKSGTYYLIYDKRNPVFLNTKKTGVFDILYKSLPENIKLHVKALSYQDIIAKIEPYNLAWLQKFKKKYGF